MSRFSGLFPQDTRGKILRLLKLRGPLTADEMSAELGITPMGVRQHLAVMKRDGLLGHRAEQRGKGRPNKVFSLTEKGDALFPRAYREFSIALLELVESLYGPEALDIFFEKYSEALETRYRARMTDSSLAELVATLAELRTEDGYMAQWEQIDEATFELREHNCPIRQVAGKCNQACKCELELFSRLLNEAKVTRNKHILQGDHTCTYTISQNDIVPIEEML